MCDICEEGDGNICKRCTEYLNEFIYEKDIKNKKDYKIVDATSGDKEYDKNALIWICEINDNGVLVKNIMKNMIINICLKLNTIK